MTTLRQKPSKGHKKNNLGNHRNHTLWLYGFHAVTAALQNKKRELIRLLITKNALEKILKVIKKVNVETHVVKPEQFLEYFERNIVHQGIALETKSLLQKSLSELLPTTQEFQAIIILDRVKDPQNVGAIIRSTRALGGTAVIGTNYHCPKESGGLVKAASGAFEKCPYIQVPNVSVVIHKLKERGFIVVGLEQNAQITIMTLLKDLKKQPIAFILGSEESGLRELTKKRCDHLVKIGNGKDFETLNVSNAAAVTLFAAKEFL